MTSKDEALKLAFEALTATMSTHGFRDAIDEAHDKAITAIEEVWAQPEEQRSCDKQEPVAVFDEKFGRPKMLANAPILTHGQKFYTTPPQREWVGLTADELNMIGDRMRTWNSHSLADVYVAIEAKLKEKNT